jgi:SAM-dependent methyltransferase
VEYKTWDEFWAKFLQVTFHKDNPDRWTAREKRAIWCQNHLEISKGASILNIGCGDGLLDICLSRIGMNVSAVDRNASVISYAQSEDDTGRVNFITTDLREMDFTRSSFDAILFLECSGLVQKEEDLELFKKIYQWLKPGGKFIVDCPTFAEESGTWSRSFEDGELTFHHNFNPDTRIFRIEPTFKQAGGAVFGLLDPIRDNLPGLSRYYYPKDEISSMLSSVGFNVAEALPHYHEKNYFAVVGIK